MVWVNTESGVYHKPGTRWYGKTKTGNPAQDATSREMVLAFGLDHIIIATDRPKDPAASRWA